MFYANHIDLSKCISFEKIKSMILVTHSIIGAAVAHRSMSAPAAFIIGLASHYIFDMVPHWHYPVPKIKKVVDGSFGKKTLTLERRLWPEFLRVVCDLGFGIGLSLAIFDGSPVVIASAVFGAVLPDLMVGLAKFYPATILVWHDKFHRWIHTPTRLDDQHLWGITSQATLALLFIWLFS